MIKLSGALRNGGRLSFVGWTPVAGNPWFEVPRDAAVARLGKPLHCQISEHAIIGTRPGNDVDGSELLKEQSVHGARLDILISTRIWSET